MGEVMNVVKGWHELTLRLGYIQEENMLRI